MTKLISFIKQNLRRRIRIQELEKIACVSKATLFRQFQNEIGCSPVEFINRERMKEAAKSLKNGSNVTETCYEFGYKSMNHFIDTFRQHYQMTPHQYRLQYRNNPSSVSN